MPELHPEFLVDEKNHPRAVLLPYPEWEKVMEELEELDDVRAYDTAKSISDEHIPFDQAARRPDCRVP